jgi:hypothetical protein
MSLPMLRLVARSPRAASVIAEQAPEVVFDEPRDVPRLTNPTGRVLAELIRRAAAMDGQAGEGDAAA